MKPITTQPFTPDLLTDKRYWWNAKTPNEIAKAHEYLRDLEVPTFEKLLAICQNDRKLFTLISTTIPTMDGWCSVPKACALAALVLARKPDTVVEIGVWAGRSLLPMAMAAKHINHGTVIGIDPYSSQESAKFEIGENADWWGKQDHKAIKARFEAFCKNFGVQDCVKLIEKPSDDVDLKGTNIQLLHVDGSHTEQAVRDAERFGPLIERGGIAVLDDIMWVGGGVLRAIDALEEMGFHEVYRDSAENWNIMQCAK